MPKILFQHIAKTAGTSLIAGLTGVFGKRTCPVRYDDELTPDLMRDDAYAFYHGHFSFDKVAEFRRLVPDLVVFTFIRHPVDRVISQYFNWIDEERTRAEYEAIEARGVFSKEHVEARLAKFSGQIAKMSLGDFIQSDDRMVMEVTLNHQTRYLSSREVFRQQPLKGLDEAAANLTGFYDFVGLTEHYEASVRLLEKRLDLRAGTLRADERRNVNDAHKRDGRYEITPGDLRLLLTHVQLDLALFSYYAGVFRERNGLLGEVQDHLFANVAVVKP